MWPKRSYAWDPGGRRNMNLHTKSKEFLGSFRPKKDGQKVLLCCIYPVIPTSTMERKRNPPITPKSNGLLTLIHYSWFTSFNSPLQKKKHTLLNRSEITFWFPPSEQPCSTEQNWMASTEIPKPWIAAITHRGLHMDGLRAHRPQIFTCKSKPMW